MTRPTFIFLSVLALASVTACSTPGNALRAEFYREEIKHLHKDSVRLYRQGSYKSAQSGFEAILDYDNQYAPAYYSIGNIALIKGEWQEALDAYKKAEALDDAFTEKTAMLKLKARHGLQREAINSDEVAGPLYQQLIRAEADQDFEEICLQLNSQADLEDLLNRFRQAYPDNLAPTFSRMNQYARVQGKHSVCELPVLLWRGRPENQAQADRWKNILQLEVLAEYHDTARYYLGLYHSYKGEMATALDYFQQGSSDPRNRRRLLN